ncbi:MAG TPA: hypothetical protein VK698_19195 [Kofleriaceae bacterium]|nr:hypothetical protein [Kofleriaceae bacterium]
MQSVRAPLSLARAAGALLVSAGLVVGCGDNIDSSPGDAIGDDDGDDVGDDIGDDDGTGEIGDACNPLGDGNICLMPWPSSAYLEPDSSTATGFRVALPVDGMPENFDSIVIDPAPWNRFDGFSPSAAMLASFPGGVSADGLPTHADPAQSLADDSLTVVVNMETGERLIHFAEVDMNIVAPEERTLIIRPLERMAPGARYAVAIRRGVLDGAGQPLTRPAGFEALLDGETIDHPRFARVAAGASAMFTALEAAGVTRDDLILAWDFVTASDASLTADLLSMRDQALPAMGEAGANLTFTAEEVEGDPKLVLRLLRGTHDAPNFLTNGEEKDSVLRRGEDGQAGPGDPGLPVMDGMYQANFSAIIPRCVETAQLPVPVMLFGHGLFGNGAGYLSDDLLQGVANDSCVVILAGDWIGLTDRQLDVAADAANDLNKSPRLSEKLAQSVINFIALEQIARGPLVDAPQFRRGGQAIIDPDRVYFFGASLGGIMGGTFMAYDPYIERGALGVPGGAWSLLFERSFSWTLLSVVANAAYGDVRDHQILIALLAWSMERWDPITTARRVLDDPLPGTPAKQLLLYEGVNDCLVTNLSTEMVARTLGVPVTGPSVKTPFGLEVTTEPVASGFTIYDEHREPGVPSTNVPPADDNGTHSGVNSNPAVLREVVGFLTEGQVRNECRQGDQPAACDCSVGACQ